MNDKYSVNKNVRRKTLMQRSDFCDYSEAYVIVKRTIDLITTKNANMVQKMFHLKCCTFMSYITKINSILTSSEEDLHTFMPMYVLEYIDN